MRTPKEIVLSLFSTESFGAFAGMMAHTLAIRDLIKQSKGGEEVGKFDVFPLVLLGTLIGSDVQEEVMHEFVRQVYKYVSTAERIKTGDPKAIITAMENERRN